MSKLHLATYFLFLLGVMYGQENSFRIQDAINFQDIVDAEVKINNESVKTDHGNYIYSPNENLVVKISKKGYEPYEETFITKIPEVLYILPLPEKLNTIVVQGKNQNLNLTQASSEIHEDKILKNTGKDLSRILNDVAGVSMMQSGGTISKPIINGLQGTRIAIMTNGVKLESQQWGMDHAPEIDPGMAKTITIIKGADAVKYGADALGGVILLSLGNLPYHGSLSGSVSSGYETNGGKFSGSAKVQGSLPSYPHFAWRVQGSAKNSGDIKTAEYYLNNTGTREYDFSTALGLDYNDYGVELFYSRFTTDLGVFYAAHVGNSDDFYRNYEYGRPAIVYDFSREINPPKQEVSHDMAKVKSYYKTRTIGDFSLQYAFQFNHREEFSLRRLDRSKIPATDMELTTHSVQLDWENTYGQNWKSEVGANYIYQENYNNPGTKAVPVIPNFASEIFGLYAIQKYTTPKWSAEAGVRYDYKDMDASGFDMYGTLYGGRRDFGNFTYNVGVAYQLTSDLYVKSNVGMAWRAPQVNELYSNGLHHGAGKFELGDSNLKSERGLKWINSVHFHNERWNIQTDFYLQKINDYIYNAPTQETRTLFSGIYPVYAYQQANALFSGIDADIRYKITPEFSYHTQTSFVWAKNTDNDTYFPYIPAPYWVNELTWDKGFNGLFKSVSLGIQHRYTAQQNRYTITNELPFDPHYLKGIKEITPPSYHLFQVSAGTNIKNIQLYAVVDNVFNTLYKDYNNRFRFFAHDMGRNIQLRAIYKF